MQAREFLLRLNLCRGVGLVSKYRLWEQACRHRCFNDLTKVLADCQLGSRSRLALEKNWTSHELDQAVEANRDYPYLTIIDAEYPAILKEIFCPPLVLFYAGNLAILQRPMLGVVGARNMTSYGERVVRGFIPPVVKKQVAIVSGLAQGIDGLSHTVTLQHGGLTVGVVGCGLDRCYPASHQALQQAVADQGLVLSEYGYGERPLAFHFPERNRVIAGLAQVLLVVEAKKRSGSLITANLALDENRTVCAIPGRVDAACSMGCNELIAAGAKPILNAQGLLEEFR
jgi:DNA processing protein